MTSPAPVGNDVVDLAHSRCRGKASDERFLARVFAPAERARIVAAQDPDRTLWMHWAAKEAAFKAISKAAGTPPPFTHAAFLVEPARGGEAGTVTYREWSVRWREDPGAADAGCLHALAWTAGGGAAAEAARIERGVARLDRSHPAVPRERFTAAELATIRGVASAWVRIHARAHLASLLGVGEHAVQIVCATGEPGRAPPRALVAGEPSTWDVSLSHHGRWLAWALRPGPGAARQNDGR